MSKRSVVLVALAAIGVLILVSCNLFPPQCALQLYEAPTISTVSGEDNVTISFQLENIGSENLENCKVQWYVDSSSEGTVGTIETNEITDWAPSIGVDLSIGETSGLITVDTTFGNYAGGTAGVDSFGIYAWGWENPPDE
jgi:hypothetical protein